MKQSIRILHVEDSPYDSELVQYLLKKNDFDCKMHRVETRDELFQKLENFDYDLILADYTMPLLSGEQALEIAHALKPQVPFIFVSGTIGEETANKEPRRKQRGIGKAMSDYNITPQAAGNLPEEIKSLQSGATDYVLKHRIDRLVPAIRRALSEASERVMLRAMRKRLREARRLEAIGTVAGGLARDFNNLLQVFRMNLDLLSLQTNHPKQVMKIAETLGKAADRGSQLMQELLVFARKVPANFASIDIVARIHETAGILRAELPPNVELVLQMDPELPPIFADPAQIRHILKNLIMNSKDAMPQGGRITVSAEIMGINAVPPHSLPVEDVLYLCLKVADTGNGMNENVRRHAFDPFFTTKPMEEGAGLGLSVVFGLMQIHNGLIELQSEVGKGTVISLFFPLPRGSRVDPKMVKKILPFQFLDDTDQTHAVLI